MGFLVKNVKNGRKLKKLGIVAGVSVEKINGEPFCDLVDYLYFLAQDTLKVSFIGMDGKEYSKLIPASELENLEFEGELMGAPKECDNKCIFCFVHQLPKGMRKSLYIRDDDWRHSLFFGNYVTMSDINNSELERIVLRSAKPLYISVHAADNNIRRKLLNNQNARDIKEVLNFFYKNEITFHAQVVLVKNINDGDIFKDTIDYLYSLYPVCASVAAVPVGLTRHREHLYPLEPIDKQTALDIINYIEKFSASNPDFAYAADEMYIRAGFINLPGAEYYNGYPQIENGVGLIAKLYEDLEYSLTNCAGDSVYSEISVATGVDIYKYILDIAKGLCKRFDIKINVYPIENNFFGKTVTVSGLLAGQDIAEQLSGKALGEMLLLAPNMLRESTDMFLDDIKIFELERKLNIKINIEGIENLPFLEKKN